MDSQIDSLEKSNSRKPSISLTESQSEKLLNLLAILPQEITLEECKNTLIRHNFDENTAALELMLPTFDHQTSTVELTRQISGLSLKQQASVIIDKNADCGVIDNDDQNHDEALENESRIQIPEIEESSDEPDTATDCNYHSTPILQTSKSEIDRQRKFINTQDQEYELALQRDMANLLERQRKIDVITKRENVLSSGKKEAAELISNIDKRFLNLSENVKSSLIRVAVKLPNGSRLEKSFFPDMTINHVRAFILLNENVSLTRFDIFSQHPHKSFLDPEELLSTAFGDSKQILLYTRASKLSDFEEDELSEYSSGSEDESDN